MAGIKPDPQSLGICVQEVVQRPSPPSKDVLERNIAKAMEWWNQQPDTAGDQLQRVLVGMGMHPSKMTKNTNLELLLGVMTVAMTCSE